jgi:FHS family glucose/mannose:H+ symporter-like MFS transporter
MKNTIWPYIIISYASLFVFGLTDNIRGPLFPEILKDFKVSDSAGSLIFALGSISGFIASRFAKFLLHRFNRKLILRYSCLGLCLSILSLSMIHHYLLFLFFSVIFGLFSGIIGLIPNVLVPLGSSPEKKQQLLSGLHAMYGVASLIAPLFVALISSYGGNWRIIYASSALIPFGLFFYSYHASHSKHHQKPKYSKEEIKEKSKINFKAQLGLAFILSFTVAAEVLISSRLALYMRREMNFNLEDSSFYVTYFFISLLAGRLLFTFIKFKQPLHYQLFAIQLLTILSIFLGLNVHPFFLVLSGFFVAPFYPLMIALISSEFTNDLDSAVSIMMATDSTMLALMHIIVGKLSDQFGIHLAMNSAIVFLSLSFFALLKHIYFKKTAPGHFF